MKFRFSTTLFSVAILLSTALCAQSKNDDIAAVAKNSKNNLKKGPKKLYIDVHHLGAGKVSAKDVEAAHQKDLSVQNKYGVKFIKYWLDESRGDIYCLVSSNGTQPFLNAHAEAHGLLPDSIYEVKGDVAAAEKGSNDFYLDLHELGAGNVTAKDAAAAHQKDLAVQSKYGVNLINYWIDEKKGTIMCLAQAPDSIALIKTHKEAHGLVPVKVSKVVQGQ